MPVYEFACPACARRYRSLSAAGAPALCPSCGAEGRKLISRFRQGRGEDARIDEMADRLETMGEPGTASGMRETVRELGKAMDEDVSAELEEMLEGDLSGSDEATE